MEGYVTAEGVFGGEVLENGRFTIAPIRVCKTLGDSVHLRMRPVTATNHKSLLAPNSAITCWCIEKETEVMNSTFVLG